MDVIGQTSDGVRVFTSELGQGQDPRVLAHELGFAIERPLDAVRNDAGVIELRFLVRPATDEPGPRQQDRGRDADLEIEPGTPIEVRQRVAAYAVVVSERGLLATEFSDRTSVPGRWGMPGGGIDTDEQPTDALLREVAEETSQQVELGPLVEVQTSHWIGRSPRDTVEDYHAVRLVYSATCPNPTQPIVLDIGGTTESARWVPLGQWRTLNWTAGWQQILRKRVGPPA
ncbi:MAG: NUDIX domain-containing protein [Propionibacteriaceae bacterium]